jgi:hypothetical protein
MRTKADVDKLTRPAVHWFVFAANKVAFVWTGIHEPSLWRVGGLESLRD